MKGKIILSVLLLFLMTTMSSCSEDVKSIILNPILLWVIIIGFFIGFTITLNRLSELRKLVGSDARYQELQNDYYEKMKWVHGQVNQFPQNIKHSVVGKSIKDVCSQVMIALKTKI